MPDFSTLFDEQARTVMWVVGVPTSIFIAIGIVRRIAGGARRYLSANPERYR